MRYLVSFVLVWIGACAKGSTGDADGGGGLASSSVTTGSDGGYSSSITTGSTNAISAGPQTCVPGTTQLCNGPGACFGAQACNADGDGYGPCVCSSDDTTTSNVSVTLAAGPATTGGGDPTCDPMSPGAVCGPGRQCIPQSNGDPVCAQAGNGNFFDLCVDFSQCLPGLDCVNDGMNSCCMAWCRRGYNDCPASFTCVEVLGNPTVDGVIYGVCWDGYPCVL
jgi:hypothetical protein